MTDFGISPEDLRRLARLVEENGLSELRYEEGDLRVTLRTSSYRSAAAPIAAVIPSALPVPEAEALAAPAALLDEEEAEPDITDVSADNLVRIEAPVMGVFYRSPAPGEPPFVEVGDRIEVGQAIGMIEAMKVFSEVLAETAGRVAEIAAKNGALVQPGDALVLLEEVEE